MATQGGVNGTAVFVVAVGSILAYSGLKNKGVSDTIRSFLAGDTPVDLPSILTGNGPSFGPNSANPGTQGLVGSGVGSGMGAIDNAMKSWGFSKAGRAGALGNLQQESGFNPNGPYGDNGTSHGIAQWHLGRLSALNAFCKVRGLNPLTLEGQLPYMHFELMSPAYADVYAYMRVANDPRAAARYWGRRYEGFGDSSGPAREQNAAQIYAGLT